MGEIRSFDNTSSGKVRTENRFPIATGENIVKGQALQLNAGGTKLEAYNSSDSRAFYAIALYDVNATSGDVYADYIMQAEEYNSRDLVFENGADTWQSIHLTARANGINIIPFIERQLTALEDESESEA